MGYYTFGILVGALTIGTLFPSCQVGQKESEVKIPEVRSKPGVEVKSTPATVEWVAIEGGLKYQIQKQGAADAKVAAEGSAVTVHYTGWLDKGGNEPGEKFDSSNDHGQPFTFTLGEGQVIAGWDKGVSGMKVGEQRRLIIPAEFAYGKRGVPGAIPPDATLIFDVELLEVN
jgi:peptidylprolyl isomerase